MNEKDLSGGLEFLILIDDYVILNGEVDKACEVFVRVALPVLS